MNNKHSEILYFTELPIKTKRNLNIFDFLPSSHSKVLVETKSLDA